MNEMFFLRRWAENAVSKIVFPGDKRKVYAELLAHMEDHRDALMEQGMTEQEACKAAEKAMGDPFAVAEELARIHRPFWGYFLRATRIVLVIAVLVTLIPLGKFMLNNPFDPPFYHSWGFYSADSYGEDTGRILRYLGKPNVSFSSDGYTFTVTNVVSWYDIETEQGQLYLEIEQFNPLPWAPHEEAGLWFRAEDSLGNHYHAHYEQDMVGTGREPHISGNMSGSGILTSTYDLWISDFPDAEWVRITYTRDGGTRSCSSV